jgi:xylulokinase
METFLVGVDVGTSSTKTLVIDQAGRVLAEAAEAYTVATPHPGWAEQDPETWVAAALTTMGRAVSEAGVDAAAVAGIGLSGQMHGTVCLDGAGRPLRPAIIWADQRSREQVARAVARLGRERLAAWTGNPLATGFMLASWLWLREHAPEICAATACLLLPKDYVRYRLTGELGTEPSDASSTSLFDPAARRWSAPLLDALAIDAGLLAPVAPSAAVAGGLLPAVAEATGLRVGTPVVHGGSDQSMQALGHGVVAPGVISSTIGTGGQILAPTLRPAVDPELRLHCFCHALPDRWHLESAMLSAGLSLRWLRDALLPGRSYAALADAAATVAPGAMGLFFQPYLAGERTPHMDPAARAAFVGLTRRHGPAHLVRAVMEGVVFGMRQGLDLMLDLGVPAARVVASGGATRHPLWLQLQADVFNRPIARTQIEEAAAFGAALLAGVGVGAYTDVAAAIAQAVRRRGHADDIAPHPARAARYAELYRAYCALYPALAPHYARLGMGTIV